MKKRFIAAGAAALLALGAGAATLALRHRAARADETPCEMTKSGVCKLHGKVKIVNSFPKYKIKIVNSFPDIKVQKVSSFPDGPGRWQFVDSFPDFTVQIVDSFPDFTVEYVNSFPGCN